MPLAKLVRPQKDLVHGHLHLVRAVAWRLWRELDSTIDFDDLVGHGTVGLLEAAHRFDRGRGVTFVTYAFHRIRGAMLDAVRVMGRFTRGEIARYRTGELVADFSAPAPSVDALLDGAPNPDDLALERDRLRTLHTAIAKLPGIERRILEKVYFEAKPLPIVGAELGLSKSWASRLHDRALKRLRKRLARET